MTVIDVPALDLAPTVPSRIVYGTVLIPTEDRGPQGAWIEVAIPGEIKLPGEHTTITGRSARFPVRPDGSFEIRLPTVAAGIEPEDWALSMRLSWRPQPFPMRVPVGTEPIWIEDCLFPELVPGEDPSRYFLAGVQIRSVTTGPSGSPAAVAGNIKAGTLSLDFTLPRGMRGEKGERGPEGPYGGTAVTDPQVASYVNDGSSAAGSALRAMFARRSGTATFWVHPSGSDTEGDGTEANPYGTINHVISNAENLILDRSAAINIQLFPTVYTETVRFAKNTGTNLNVNIYGHPVGGHPNVPQTVFQGDPSASIPIYSANQSHTLRVEDIKFVGYEGIAISMTRGDLFVVNVHAENCGGGVRVTNGAIDVKGGIYTNVGYRPSDGARAYSGVTSFMANRHSIGEQHGDLSQGPWFFGGYRGVLAQECATGHVDYCTFEDLEVAVTANRQSSINPDGSSFKRNGIDLRAINGASIVAGARVQHGTGADASDQQMHVDATSHIATGDHWSGPGTGAAISERLHTEDSLTRVVSTGATESLLRRTLTPFFFNDAQTPGSAPSKALVVRVTGEITDPAGRKRFAFAIGAGSVTATILNGRAEAFTVEFEVIFRDQGSQVMRSTALLNGEPAAVRVAETTVDISTSPEMVLNLQRLDGTGTVRIYSVQTWFRGI